MFLVGNVDGRDAHRVARKCAGTGGRCSVSGQKHLHPMASKSRSKLSSSRDHPPSPNYLSRLPWYYECTTIPENTSFEWEEVFINASKDIGMGVSDLAPIVVQSQ